MGKKRARLEAWEERCKFPIPGKRNPYKRTPKGQKSRPKPPPFDWEDFKRRLAGVSNMPVSSGCSCSTIGCEPGCPNSASTTFDCPVHGQGMFRPCDCSDMSTIIRISG